MGLEFSQACEEASAAFLEHFRPEIEPFIADGIAELMLLSKGLYYWMHNAFARVFHQNLEINLAAAQRAEVSNDAVRIEIPYFNFDSPAENLIIGDTIASGATICAALSMYLQRSGLKRIFVFSIAGSVVGGQAIAKFCRSNEIDLTLAYGLAAFGLGVNGFDLSFLHPETITNKKYLDHARTVYKDKPISAVGWDFGTQAQATRKYKMLCWLEEKYWAVENDGVFALTERPGDSALVNKERVALGRERDGSSFE